MTALHVALEAVEAEHRERAASFVRDVMRHSRTKWQPLGWNKCLAEGLPADVDQGGWRAEEPIWVPEAVVVEELERAGFRVQLDEKGRRYVRCRLVDPRKKKSR